MSETIQVNDPVQLAELLEKIEGLKAVFSNAARKEAERGKRDKYKQAIRELANAELPYITLSRETFKNKSEASMRSQFKRIAEEINAGFEPTLVEYEGTLLLVNFDNETAQEKFNNYILKLAGVSEDELRKLAADLDNATR